MTGVQQGIYAAVVTPYDNRGRPDHDQLANCLDYLAERGCQGVLLAGTTGEGPSLSVEERSTLFRAAARASRNLCLLGGTGAASLEDSVRLTRAAFRAGLDGVAVVPPFFYGSADDEGLFHFYTAVIRRSVPTDGAVLLYHNPAVCGVGLSLDLCARLRDAFPAQVVGIKDSSNDWEHTLALIQRIPGFQVFTGDGRALARTLAAGGAGSVTFIANAFADLARDVYDRHCQSVSTDETQERLAMALQQFDNLPRIAALKMILKAGGIITNDAVRPPLRRLTADEETVLRQRFLLDMKIPKIVHLSDLTRDV